MLLQAFINWKIFFLVRNSYKGKRDITRTLDFLNKNITDFNLSENSGRRFRRPLTEKYHQDYYKKRPEQRYCHCVIQSQLEVQTQSLKKT